MHLSSYTSVSLVRFGALYKDFGCYAFDKSTETPAEVEPTAGISTNASDGKSLLGWSLLNNGLILRLYSLPLFPAKGCNNDQNTSQFISSEYKLPRSAVSEPIIFKCNSGALTVAVFTLGGLLVIFKVERNPDQSFKPEGMDPQVFHIPNLMESTSCKTHMLTYFVQAGDNVAIFVREDGLTFNMEITENANYSHATSCSYDVKISNLMPKWSSEVTDELFGGSICLDKRDHLLYGVSHLCTEGRNFIVYLFKSKIILWDIVRACIEDIVDFAEHISARGSHIPKLVNKLKTFFLGENIYLTLAFKSENGDMGILIYRMNIPPPEQHVGKCYIEFLTTRSLPSEYNSYKIHDLVLFQDSEKSRNTISCLIKKDQSSIILFNEITKCSKSSGQWTKAIFNELERPKCYDLSDLSSDEIIDLVFNEDVFDYVTIRDSVLRFANNGFGNLSLIYYPYKLKDLKLLAYYSIINKTRETISELCSKSCSDTIGYTDLHYVFLQNFSLELLSICEKTKAQEKSPLCIAYSKELLSLFTLGSGSLGILRKPEYFEILQTLKNDPRMKFGVSSYLDNEDELKKFERFISLRNKVPTTPEIIFDIVETFIYKEVKCDIPTFFDDFSNYIFQKEDFNDKCIPFCDEFRLITNPDEMFSTIIYQFEHIGYIQERGPAGNYPCIFKELATCAYSQNVFWNYSSALDIIVVLLCVQFLHREGILDIGIQRDILQRAYVVFNSVAVQRALSSRFLEHAHPNANNSKVGEMHDVKNSLHTEPNTEAKTYFMHNEDIQEKIHIHESSYKGTTLMKIILSSGFLEPSVSAKGYGTYISQYLRLFARNLLPLFTISLGAIKPTKNALRLVVELIKLGNYEIAQKIALMLPKHPILDYIHGTINFNKGNIYLAQNYFRKFAIVFLNDFDKDQEIRLTDLREVLPNELIESKSIADYYEYLFMGFFDSDKGTRSTLAIYEMLTMCSVYVNEKDIYEPFLDRLFNLSLKSRDISSCVLVLSEMKVHMQVEPYIKMLVDYCFKFNEYEVLVKNFNSIPDLDLLEEALLKKNSDLSFERDIEKKFFYTCVVFSFYTNRCKFKKSCSFMYKFLLDLSLYVKTCPSIQSMHLSIMCKGYSLIINTLKSLGPMNRWFIKEDDGKSVTLQNERRVEIVYLKDIKYAFSLAFSATSMMYYLGKLEANFKLPTIQEALMLYVESNDYGLAFSLAREFGLDYGVIFKSMSKECIATQTSPQNQLPHYLKTPLNYPSPAVAYIIQQNTHSSQRFMWEILRHYLAIFDGKQNNYKYSALVADSILSLNRDYEIPYCIRQNLQCNSINELLKIYLNHKRIISAATLLTSEIIKTKDSLVKDGSTGLAQISPFIIDQTLIQLRKLCIKSVNNIPELKKLSLPKRDEYKFESYCDTLKLIFDSIAKNPRYMPHLQSFKVAFELHSGIKQYVDIVINAEKSIKQVV